MEWNVKDVTRIFDRREENTLPANGSRTPLRNYWNHPRSLLSKVTQLFLLSFFILFQNTSVTSHCVIHVLNKRWLSTITSRSPITTSSVHRLKNTNFCYLHASFLFILKPFFFFFFERGQNATLLLQIFLGISPFWVFLLITFMA